MRKRSLWSQHICYTVIPLPTLPGVEREDVRDVFPWHSSCLAQSPTEQWELSTSSWDRSKWKSIGKMVAGCKGGWFYPQICWFLYRRSPSSVSGCKLWCPQDALGTWEQQSSQGYKWTSPLAVALSSLSVSAARNTIWVWHFTRFGVFEE